MTNLLAQAINCDDPDQAARIIRDALHGKKAKSGSGGRICAYIVGRQYRSGQGLGTAPAARHRPVCQACRLRSPHNDKSAGRPRPRAEPFRLFPRCPVAIWVATVRTRKRTSGLPRPGAGPSALDQPLRQSKARGRYSSAARSRKAGRPRTGGPASPIPNKGGRAVTLGPLP
jgi:hypothetical protein